VLLNDPSFVEAARVFAARILREGGETVDGRIRWTFEQALSRTPSPAEVAALDTLYQDEQTWYAEHPEAAEQLASVGQAIPPDVDAVELAAWTAVARALFNTHEFVMRY
jgi:hypothetical protein